MRFRKGDVVLAAGHERIVCGEEYVTQGWTHADGTPIEPPKAITLTGVPQDEAIDPKACTPVDFALGESTPEPEGWGGTNGFRRPVYSVNRSVPFETVDAATIRADIAKGFAGAKTGTLTHPDLQPGETTLYDREGASTTLHADGSITMRHGKPIRLQVSVDTDRLARALFETDPDVISFVNRRSENDVSEKRAAIMQRGWDRGHAGESPEWKWYVRAVDRAKAMAGKLGGGA